VKYLIIIVNIDELHYMTIEANFQNKRWQWNNILELIKYSVNKRNMRLDLRVREREKERNTSLFILSTDKESLLKSEEKPELYSLFVSYAEPTIVW